MFSNLNTILPVPSRHLIFAHEHIQGQIFHILNEVL